MLLRLFKILFFVMERVQTSCHLLQIINLKVQAVHKNDSVFKANNTKQDFIFNLLYNLSK